jgi:hypothetical protein
LFVVRESKSKGTSRFPSGMTNRENNYKGESRLPSGTTKDGNDKKR